jgi:hypothetical protein
MPQWAAMLPWAYVPRLRWRHVSGLLDELRLQPHRADAVVAVLEFVAIGIAHDALDFVSRRTFRVGLGPFIATLGADEQRASSDWH